MNHTHHGRYYTCAATQIGVPLLGVCVIHVATGQKAIWGKRLFQYLIIEGRDTTTISAT